MIQDCRNDKRKLYERMVLGEISVDVYKEEKSKIDAELSRLTQIRDVLKAETAASAAAAALSRQTLRRVADEALTETKLTRELSELLIDRVNVYPGNRIEVVWKITDFAATDRVSV
jgi:hypothetical protein